MAICENCKIEHLGTYGSGRFCSQKCSNTYSSNSNKQKKSASLSVANKKRAQIDPNYGFKNKELHQKANELAKLSISKKLSIIRNHDQLKKFVSTDTLRKNILKEQNHKCNRCHNDTWLGQTLTLELEHIDGDTTNNERSNLEALCPNCHSLTKTWRGRNKSKYKINISDEVLLNALKTQPTIRKALISVGLAGKGGNYKRCYQLLANNINLAGEQGFEPR